MKSNIKLFEETIENITVPGNLSYEKAMELTAPITKIVNDIMPKRLYRFRKCDELNIDAFNTDRVFVSRGIDVNDVYDTCLHCDIDAICNNLINWNYESLIEDLCYTDDFVNLLKQSSPDRQYDIDKLVMWSNDCVKKMIIGLKTDLKNKYSQEMTYIVGEIQEGIRFACFAEDINSSIMWGHYADASTGFALEYDFKHEIIDTASNECNDEKISRNSAGCFMYPVIYTPKLYDATDFALYLFQYRILLGILPQSDCINYRMLLNEIFPCPDNYKFSKIAIHKSLEWQYEKEWRLFYTSKNPQFNCEQHSYVYKTPTAIYLGRRISQINEKILKDIAREKNIKCYKMNLDNSIEDYKLIPELQTL